MKGEKGPAAAEIHGDASSRRVLERCRRPLRAGSLDPLDPAVGTGQAGNAGSGDLIRIQVRVREGRVIEEARFKVFGCGSSIASASLAAEWAIGSTLEEALEIRSTRIARELELPASRIRCSILAEAALRAAVEDYLGKSEALAWETYSGGTG